MEQMDLSRLRRELSRAHSRDGAALSDSRRPGAAAVYLAGELQPEVAPDPDVGPIVVLGRPVRTARTVPNARVGRGHLAAQRGSAGRKSVHGRSVPRL